MVVIVDYGMGNLFSVSRKLKRIGAPNLISSRFSEILNADKIILPGVGHFGKAMANLKNLNLLEPLNEAILVQKKPILGICLGMQLMAKHSEEGDADGLGWMDGEVVRFRMEDTQRFKVPHMGWNTLEIVDKSHPLFKNLPEEAEFYFVHAFHMKCHNPKDLLSNTHYGYSFPSAVASENIMGVQFHPEKSHHWGDVILENFLNL